MTDLHIKQGVPVSLRGVLGRGVSTHRKGAAKSGQLRNKFNKTILQDLMMAQPFLHQTCPSCANPTFLQNPLFVKPKHYILETFESMMHFQKMLQKV